MPSETSLTALLVLVPRIVNGTDCPGFSVMGIVGVVIVNIPVPAAVPGAAPAAATAGTSVATNVNVTVSVADLFDTCPSIVSPFLTVAAPSALFS
jgi:hypothetical protein